jgi:cyanophycinase
MFPSSRLLIRSLVILCFIAAAAYPAQAQKGSLVIVGGGDRLLSVMKRFVDLAGGGDAARIAVFPNASGDPMDYYNDIKSEFEAVGAKQIQLVVITHEQALDPKTLDRLAGLTGVFFTGGDQVRITHDFLGTPVHDWLRAFYEKGGVIGGTSAGAAMMSRVMITGDERLNADTVRNFLFIKGGNVVTVEGMGFITDAIIDQHFLIRKRHNRLISVVLEHPELPGIGIDETAAVVVSPDHTFEVLGEGNVVVYDARKATDIRRSPKGYLTGSGLTMHVLTVGDRYDLKRSKVIPGACGE